LKGKIMKKLAMSILLGSMINTVHAQNVSVYGVIDTGFQSHNNGTQTYTRAQNNAWGTSRLGFRGSEDLGNGVEVKFMLEGAVAASNGTMGSTSTNEVFNREAWVGFASKSLGEVRFGRGDVTDAQNVESFVSQFANFGNRAINGTAVELGVDQKNVIRYLSPTVSGFQADIAYASGNAAGDTTDAAGDQKGIMVSYRQDRVRAFVGYATMGATSTAGDRDFTTYGASYDFGVVSVGAAHGRGDVNNANGAENTVTQGSVRMPLANGVALHGVYAVAKDASQSTAGEGKGYTLGVTKALSKRTTLYAAYTAVDNQANAKMYMSGQVAAPAAGGLDPKTTSVGISHTF
jgi:predicted porin